MESNLIQAHSAGAVALSPTAAPVVGGAAHRIAALDWMRGLVMGLMVIDHVSMGYDPSHLAEDSALYGTAASLPAVTRWITHLCAPKPRVGVRPNGAFLVFGQTALFFYLVHRLVLEVPATYFGLRGAGNLATSYIISGVLLVALYAPCRWFRTVKAAHPDSILKYF